MNKLCEAYLFLLSWTIDYDKLLMWFSKPVKLRYGKLLIT